MNRAVKMLIADSIRWSQQSTQSNSANLSPLVSSVHAEKSPGSVNVPKLHNILAIHQEMNYTMS